MTKNKFDEPTPTYQSFPFTEAELEVINLYAMINKILLRDFYAEAYAREVERRSRWSPRHDMDRYVWMAYPSDHPDTERRTVVTHEEQVRELEKWAARDGVKKAVAHYTAVFRHILHCREELKNMGYPLQHSSYEDDEDSK